ncbi:MAG: hypothetical protein O7H41_18980 [Planctomycetota bacterium]|nr:hypothetical protein [Planctomycetota bacterium]
MKSSVSVRAVLLGLAVFLAAPAIVRAEITEEEKAKLDQLRDECRVLVLIQSKLDWYNRTQGEESITKETYKGHEHLFSKETIQFVDGLISRTEDPDEKRRLRFLQGYLLWDYISLRTAHFGDALKNAESNTKVEIEWITEPVSYRDLDGLLDNESDPKKRQELQAAQAGVWKEKLNPILEEEEKKVLELVQEVGYGYIELSEKLRFVDLGKLISKSQEFIKKTDGLYRELFAKEVRESLGIEPEEFTRAEIGRLLGAKQFDKFFPPELMVLSFRVFLEGIGIDFGTAAGTEITIDDSLHPKKNPRAACYAMVVPRDVRVTVKPTGGIGDFDTFFHEGGHAIHFANTTTKAWEFQALGNNTTTEGYAEFFAYVWGDPVWLKRYREIVKNYNRYSGNTTVPLMTDKDIGLLLRKAVLKNLYFVRRYAGAKLLYESILHDGKPELYKAHYDGQTEDLQEVYRVIFGDAYGFELKPMEAMRFRTDVDSFLYSADYSRAYLMAMQLHETLQKQHGDDWYDVKEVGTFLKEKLFRDGTKLQGPEVSKILGFEDIDYGAYGRQIHSRLAASAALLK